MIPPDIQILGIPFALITGTGAGVFALLSWGIFRDSPFGLAIALLSLVMCILTIYHTMLLIVGPDTLVLHVLRSSANTIIAIFLGLLILRHYQVRQASLWGELSWAD